jgi:hypothetical protein
MQSLLRHIHHLRALKVLTLANELNPDVNSAALDFSQLALLPKLDTFAITFNKNRMQLTPAQVGQLAACQSLKSIHAGRWTREERFPCTEQQLEERLGQLVRGVLARPALAAAAGREPVPLQKLYLGIASVLTPPVWQFVSQLTDLTELVAWWSLDLTDADWRKLSGMRQLRDLSIAFRDGQTEPPPLDFIFSALPPTLTDLQLQMSTAKHGLPSWLLSAEQMSLLVRTLPHLQSLQLRHVRVDPTALAHLSRLPSLDLLSFDGCAATKAEAVALRLALPPLAHLADLFMEEVEGVRLTAAEAEPLVGEIVARCPKLTRNCFKQNLSD